LVECLFKDKMPAEELQQLLTLVFYPAEVVEMLETKIRTAQAQKNFAIKTLRVSSSLYHLIIDDILHDKVSSPGQPSAEFTRPKSECSRARRS
jgi:fructose-1,6-bisphosphatase